MVFLPEELDWGTILKPHEEAAELARVRQAQRTESQPLYLGTPIEATLETIMRQPSEAALYLRIDRDVSLNYRLVRDFLKKHSEVNLLTHPELSAVLCAQAKRAHYTSVAELEQDLPQLTHLRENGLDIVGAAQKFVTEYLPRRTRQPPTPADQEAMLANVMLERLPVGLPARPERSIPWANPDFTI